MLPLRTALARNASAQSRSQVFTRTLAHQRRSPPPARNEVHRELADQAGPSYLSHGPGSQKLCLRRPEALPQKPVALPQKLEALLQRNQKRCPRNQDPCLRNQKPCPRNQSFAPGTRRPASEITSHAQETRSFAPQGKGLAPGLFGPPPSKGFASITQNIWPCLGQRPGNSA